MRSEQGQTSSGGYPRVTVTSPSRATSACTRRVGTWAQGCLKDRLRHTGYCAGPADIEAKTPVTILSHCTSRCATFSGYLYWRRYKLRCVSPWVLAHSLVRLPSPTPASCRPLCMSTLRLLVHDSTSSLLIVPAFAFTVFRSCAGGP